MDDKKIDKLAEDLTFPQLAKLIGRTVQLGWIEFTENYTNELGDFENYKNVFLESLEEDFDELEELKNDNI